MLSSAFSPSLLSSALLSLPLSTSLYTTTKDFNQSLDQVDFPSGLQFLDFGASFNQPLLYVTLPVALKSSLEKNQNRLVDPLLDYDYHYNLLWAASKPGLLGNTALNYPHKHT